MKIEQFDFENTAKAVYVMNDSARELYSSWDELREFMINIAYQYAGKTSNISTGGFLITFYNAPDGEVVARASVTAYVAMLYVNKVECLEGVA